MKRGFRRSADALAAPTYVEDKDSGELRRPHHVDLKTGMYRGRQILKPKSQRSVSFPKPFPVSTVGGSRRLFSFAVRHLVTPSRRRRAPAPCERHLLAELQVDPVVIAADQVDERLPVDQAQIAVGAGEVAGARRVVAGR